MPPLLAVVATCDLAAADADYEAALRDFARLRLAVLIDPEAARREFCAERAAADASSRCQLTLRRGTDGEGDAATCATRWPSGPPRFYVISARCLLPNWAASLNLPPLEARILR